MTEPKCPECDDSGIVELTYMELYYCGCEAGERLRAERDNDSNHGIDTAREREEERLINDRKKR